MNKTNIMVNLTRATDRQLKLWLSLLAWCI